MLISNEDQKLLSGRSCISYPIKSTRNFEQDMDLILPFMTYPIPDNINRFLKTPYFKEYVGSSLIGTIYPGVSFYCLQTYKKILCMVNYGKYLSDPRIHQWLKETFSPDMFLGMLNIYYENNGLNELIITLDGIFSKIVELITEKIDVLIPEQCDLANLHNLISNSCL